MWVPICLPVPIPAGPVPTNPCRLLNPCRSLKTNKGLFEPIVMFFGLCNSLAMFQAMINKIFKEMLDEGWMVIYMDDILTQLASKYITLGNKVEIQVISFWLPEYKLWEKIISKLMIY